MGGHGCGVRGKIYILAIFFPDSIMCLETLKMFSLSVIKCTRFFYCARDKVTKQQQFRIFLKKNCTTETWFSEPRFSEILDLMNKIQLPWSYIHIRFLNRLDLVNMVARSLLLTKSRLFKNWVWIKSKIWQKRVGFYSSNRVFH